MSKSNRVPFTELRQASRLVQECCDLGDDPPAWHHHMLVGLLQLLGGSTAASGVICASPGREPSLVHMAVVGPEPWLRYCNDQYSQSGAFARTITYQRFGQQCFEKVARRGRVPVVKLLLTRSNEQLFSRVEWECSDEFNELRKPLGLDDQLTTCNVVSPSAIYGWALHRASDDRPFGSYERRLLHMFHHQLARYVGTAISWEPDGGFSGLPVRLRQTLICLLEGDSEKQAAAHLGLSRSTAHGYVAELYRRFAVNTRAELLVRCLHRWQPEREPNATFLGLPPSLRRTLLCLLEGESEKQAAAHLGLSRYTVHEYVTGLYQRFGVRSRPELLVRCLHHRPPMLE
jgi:DNA-binding NarL/FixJ family response regulator